MNETPQHGILKIMKTLFLEKKNIDISRHTYLLSFVAIIALRLLLTGWQKLQLDPETSMLDDMLMYKLAKNVAAGEWFGNYTYLTLAKRALYAVWLAMLNKLGISVLLAGNILAVLAAIAICEALNPAFKSRFAKLAIFAVLVFSPNSYADFTLRVYRDNISTSFSMFFFAGAIGLVLRAGQQKYRCRNLIGWGVLCGISLGCCLLLREDAAWLLIFAVPAAVVYIFQVFHSKCNAVIGKLCVIALTAALTLGCVGAYAGMNYKYYGRFVISDLTSSEFTAAYGAMTRIIVPSDEKNAIVPVPASSREKLANASPAFAELMPYLESAEFSIWQKDCGNGKLEYSGGGFYWAVRNAASLLGYYETPQKAQEYFTRLADEINAAADSGALGEVIARRSGLNSPVTSDYIMPTLAESLDGLLRVVTYSDVRCDPTSCTGSQLVLDEMEDFLHCEGQRSTREYIGSSERELVVWAVSSNGRVGVELTDENNNRIAIDDRFSTAGDIYLDFLFDGRDIMYTNGSRHSIYFDSAENSGNLSLILNNGESCVEISLSQQNLDAGEITTVDGITYRIEYYGEAAQETTVFGFAELWLYRAMRVVVLLYHIIGVVMFIGGTISLFYCCSWFIRKKRFLGCEDTASMCLCALACAALRIGMMAFADCSAFGLGLYSMYLAAVWPLMTIWETLAAICKVKIKSNLKSSI